MMKTTISITLIALLGSSVAMTMSRGEPRPGLVPKQPVKFDPSKYDHIVAEVRPLGVKQSLNAVEAAPHHPEQAERPHHSSGLHQHEQQMQHHHGLNFEAQHHKLDPSLIDVEFHHQQQQQQPPQRIELEITHVTQQQQQPQNQQVEFEITQVDRNPQKVQMNVHSHHGHEQPMHHGLDFEVQHHQQLQMEPKPHHVEMEFKPIEPKPLELVHPYNF